MIVDCISDLHGFLPQLSGGDLLIVAGDLTARNTPKQYDRFDHWLSEQPYRKKIFIAGNHDGILEKENPRKHMFKVGSYEKEKFEYLQDSGTEFEGLKIWGSPWTPTFLDWHFMKNRGDDIRSRWDLIPEDTDILITHGPPYGILDQVKFSSKANSGKFAGCEELRTAVERVKPRLHVFGHIHEGYGQLLLKCTFTNVICVNASVMNEYYDPVNKPIRITL